MQKNDYVYFIILILSVQDIYTLNKIDYKKEIIKYESNDETE